MSLSENENKNLNKSFKNLKSLTVCFVAIWWDFCFYFGCIKL